MDVQAGWHGSTVHAQGFSCSKGEADYCDVIRWHHYCGAYIEGGELYKESMHEPQCSCLGFWLQLLWCLSRSGTITRKGSVLYLFNCKCSRLAQVPWVSLLQLFASNQVAYHPESAQTWYWSSEDHNLLVLMSAHRINCYFGEPTNPSSIPENSHICVNVHTYTYYMQAYRCICICLYVHKYIYIHG